MLQRNGQVPNATILHQMVHSTSSNTRTRTSNRKRNISESTSSDSECESRWKENDELFISIFLVETSISTPMHFEDQIDRQSKELISIVHQAFKETLEVKRKISKYGWEKKSTCFRRRIFRFVKTMVTPGLPVWINLKSMRIERLNLRHEFPVLWIYITFTIKFN